VTSHCHPTPHCHPVGSLLTEGPDDYIDRDRAYVTITVSLSWLDRLRVLLGREVVVRVDVPVALDARGVAFGPIQERAHVAPLFPRRQPARALAVSFNKGA
jgi:hypothetical protein